MLRYSPKAPLAGVAALAFLVPLGGTAAAAAPRGVKAESASPVTSVSREDIEALPTNRRLEDLLRTCPAQTIPTTSGGTQVNLRGLGTTAQPPIDCIRPEDIRMIQVYNAHNAERARYGYRPLVWNITLADNAQNYANQLARTGQLVHASREGRGTERENISSGLPNWSANQLMGSWLNERPLFRPGTFPDISITGDWAAAGHYSQMIWPTTTDLGCGMAVGGRFSWLVCRYNPGGNKDGKPVGFPVTLAESPNWNAVTARTPSLIEFGPNGEIILLTDPFLDDCLSPFPDGMNIFEIELAELTGSLPSPPATQDSFENDFISPREFRFGCRLRF